ncbi:MAG: radical SAM protein [Candidatus Eisenbacteria bacterium]
MSDHPARLSILKTAPAAPGLPAGLPADETLVVHELYVSVQGESTRAGRPCTFVRLAACHLRCTWCDTPHAFDEGARHAVDDVVADAHGRGIPLVEITGGEPLLQAGVYPLMARLCDLGHAVLLETSGALDIGRVDPRVVRIVDFKCPASGEVARNRWENVALLAPHDEVKFVLADRADYEWARGVMREHRLERRCEVLLSTAHGRLAPADVVRWMLEDGLDARFQLQMHKVIWDPNARGV